LSVIINSPNSIMLHINLSVIINSPNSIMLHIKELTQNF